MTRLFTDGAEMQDLNFWDSWTSFNAVTVANASPAPFASAYYYRVGSSGAENFLARSFPSLTEMYWRGRVNTYVGGGSIANALRIAFLKKTTTYIGGLTLDAARHWCTYTGVSTLFEDSGIVCNANQWYLVEMYYKMANAPDGQITVKIDGTQILNLTGDTKPGADANFDNISHESRNSGTEVLCLDDMALNDTTGAIDNSWCGDGIIGKIYPSGSGTVNNFLNSGSTSGSSNYTYVDEYPYDGDTSYTYVSGSSIGAQDQYRMSSFSGTNKLITRIYTESRIRKTQAVETSTVKTGFQTSGSTPQVSASRTLLLNYDRIIGDDAVINPATGLAWTEGDINTLEYVIER